MNEPKDILRSFSAEEQTLISEVLVVLKQIRFGSVEIVVHDGDVVQFERREKVRRHGSQK